MCSKIRAWAFVSIRDRNASWLWYVDASTCPLVKSVLLREDNIPLIFNMRNGNIVKMHQLCQHTYLDEPISLAVLRLSASVIWSRNIGKFIIIHSNRISRTVIMSCVSTGCVSASPQSPHQIFTTQLKANNHNLLWVCTLDCLVRPMCTLNTFLCGFLFYSKFKCGKK